MTNKGKIEEAARALVLLHGTNALAVAEAEIIRHLDDELTCIVWVWIAHCLRQSGKSMLAALTTTNDQKIWDAARILIHLYGPRALTVAQGEIMQHLDDDDELTCVVWVWIAHSVGKLLTLIPTGYGDAT